MSITFIDLFLAILNRNGAMPLFLALAIVSLLAAFYISKAPKLRHPATVLAVVILTCSLAGGFAAAPAAWRSGIRLLQVFQAVFSVQPSNSGPFVVEDTKVALATPLANADLTTSETILVHFFYPVRADSERAIADQGQIACGHIDGIIRLPEARQPYRLVLLAPGLNKTPSSMSLVARNLASHGYVVAGINDPARDALRSGASASDEEIRLRPFDFSSDEALAGTMRRGSVRAEQVASRALTILDRLEVCIQNSARLQGRIDVKRVGFVGYSFGGAAAAESSFMDSRIAAVVNLDGWLFGRATVAPVSKPILFMCSDFGGQALYDPSSPQRFEFKHDQNNRRLLEVQAKRPDSYLFIIDGIDHDMFEDPSSSLRNLIKWLVVDPYRAHAIIDAYLIGFLDAYLKGDRRGLIGANDPRYLEVRPLNSQD